MVLKRIYHFATATGVVLLSFIGVNSAETDITDLISPIRLEAGKVKRVVVSDLFYAPEYILNFKQHANIAIEFDTDNNQLFLTPAMGFEGLTTISFELNQQEYHIPVFSTFKQRHTIKFSPGRKPTFRLNIMGTFNDWNRSSLPMQDDDGDGTYEIELELDPGQYLYQFVLDDKEIYDPENTHKVDNGFGSYNSVVQVLSRHSNRAYLHLLGFEKRANETVLQYYFENGNEVAPVREKNIIALLNNRLLPSGSITVNKEQIHLRIKSGLLQGDNTVRLAVTNDGQTSNLQSTHLRAGQPVAASDKFAAWNSAIIYSLMVDRFNDGETTNNQPVVHDSLSGKANYQGGDLQGILAKLNEGYFDSLGVTVLWLSPLNENTDQAFREWPEPHRFYSGYHGYWPTHHEHIESRFGDLNLLKSVVRVAHRQGIKVLLDFVANHVHQEHPFFQQHPDWFGTYDLPDGRKNIRLWDEFRLTTWFEPFLPSFDYSGSVAAVAAVTSNAVWWLNESGADGFRHDAVKHVPNHFWRELTRKLRSEVESRSGNKVFQIGETFGSYDLIGSYINKGQLDAQFNFNLYDTAIYVFLNQDASFAILARELDKTISMFGMNNLMGNVMDSHDKPRFIAYADEDVAPGGNDAQEIGWIKPPTVDHEASYDKVKLYMTYLLTIPGVPVLFYGDEIGLAGAGDPDNRRMMRFGEQLAHAEKRLLTEVSKIVHARRDHSALCYGDFQTLHADQDVFIYLRSDFNERVLVALNKSAQVRSIEVDLPEFYGLRAAEPVIADSPALLTENNFRTTLAAYSGGVWILR